MKLVVKLNLINIAHEVKNHIPFDHAAAQSRPVTDLFTIKNHLSLIYGMISF